MAVFVQRPGLHVGDFPLEPRSARAARMFPAAWASASQARGPTASKRRQRLRALAELLDRSRPIHEELRR